MRDFNYVDDVVDALLAAATSDKAIGEIFNLGSDEVISLKKLAAALIKLNGGGKYKVCAFPPSRKKIDIGDYYSDYQAIKNALGWRPKVSLEKGLSATLAFYRKNIGRYI
jgi:nucleoside-diphosphate-sugar epimerase